MARIPEAAPVNMVRQSRQPLSLSTEQCFDLLATQQVGRVVFSDNRGPLALPVNFVVQDSTVLVRTSPGNTLARHLSESPTCAFEVDEIDPALHTGWSVLVRGSASVVRHLSQDPDAQWPGPWAPGERHLLLRITPDEISGRRLVP
jgi:nitroimidazol reductase NimA-like FMN-containing flavoprotein (pyridoxamine 5'-phosphate oxidase superfamily)